ncbi:hypothetical protein GCM10009827_104980 [Dactylosporangium maewongense]|uniref:Major facilitator superfamily (MFS) profile domain-containing protein n=1 Tax=Dactylosporangium maewongense TaxID=634393 RepID=A0ABN2CXP4_9ACTN
MYIAASVAGLVFSHLIATAGWTTAAMIQIVGLSTLGAVLVLALRPHLFGTIETSQEN